ncbi:ABC-F family ATP-binding cassette domain-containing protein [Candidatus Babeliales bacterium]|nr:ABC-F family ATP-binding cassette domain-containing protein [Candidatus Babeliales bacterium]
MISLNNLSLAFGSQQVFDKVSCSIGSQRVGLVGRNGAGKSTLLKIISGEQELDSGVVSIERGKKMAYMPQEVVLLSDRSVLEETMMVFQEFIFAEKEQKDIEQQLTEGADDIEKLLERYEEVLALVARFDKHNAEREALMILKGLGFTDERLASQVNELSVGWKMRIVLAKLLLQKADFYLFDEPTNHLDIVAKEWFSDFLSQTDSGFLLVTHDRYFLEHACNAIFELERGKGTWYQGNFSKYLALKEERQAVTLSAYNRQQKEIEQKKATINRFKASASKSSMAQSMMKQLDKMEIIEVAPPLPKIKLNFPPVKRSGIIVLDVKEATKSFDEKLIFKNASCEVKRGEKVAIVAANGVGKTTFFNLVASAYPEETDMVSFGHNVEIAVFEQEQVSVLDLQKTVYNEVGDAVPAASEATLRSFLGSFLFSGDEIKKKCGVLSGGERNRVAMIKVLMQNANFLLLDESTNHLDLYAKDILLQALKKYEGTILFVSHDHDFVQHLATRVIELTPDGMHSYQGDYESYLFFKKKQEAERQALLGNNITEEEKPKKSNKKEKKSGKSDKQKKKEISKLESQIHTLEGKIEKLSNEFIGLVYGTSRYQEVESTIAMLQKDLDGKKSEKKIL